MKFGTWNAGRNMDDKTSLVNHDACGGSIQNEVKDDEHVNNNLEEIPESPHKANETKVYLRRWYIILAFTGVNIAQNLIWNTFAPITKPAERVYHWQDYDIAMISNMGPFAYFVAVFLFSWIMDTKGLRPAVVITASLVAVGSGLRCFLFKPSTLTTSLVYIGHFLNGLAGPVAMSAGPLISAVWFPVQERTTATTVAAQLAYVGLSLSFLIGPYMVPDTSYQAQTSVCNHGFVKFYVDNITYCANVEKERLNMKYFMYTEFGIAAVFLIVVLLYFPNKPPIPPSITAAKERLEFKRGFLSLLQNFQFWLVFIAYGLSNGVYGAWSSVLNVSLQPLHVSEVDAGWIGFLMQIIPSFISILLSRIVDYLSCYLKPVLIILYLISSALFTLFLLVVLKDISVSLVFIYIIPIAGSIFLIPSIPLFYELAAEISYPVAEGITTGLLTLSNNGIALLFLLIPLLPNIGTVWMNYLVVGAIGACLPVLIAIKERKTRTDLDKQLPPTP